MGTDQWTGRKIGGLVDVPKRFLWRLVLGEVEGVTRGRRCTEEGGGPQGGGACVGDEIMSIT